MKEVKDVRVRLCPAGAPTFEVVRSFQDLPFRGESIFDDDGERYVVVAVDWLLDGSPYLVAHAWSRPTAQTAAYGRAT